MCHHVLACHVLCATVCACVCDVYICVLTSTFGGDDEVGVRVGVSVMGVSVVDDCFFVLILWIDSFLRCECVAFLRLF